MAIFHDTGENAAIFDHRDKCLDEDTLKAYQEKFGAQRAIGYMEAMRDFNHQLKILFGGGYTHTGLPRSDAKIRKRIKQMFHENDELLHVFITKISDNVSPSP